MPKNVKDYLDGNPKNKRPEGICIDLLEADTVELLYTEGGRVWVNVDGICLVRVRHALTIVSHGSKEQAEKKS